MSTCSQCGKPAVDAVEDTPLCVDCFSKYQHAVELENARLERHTNYFAEAINASMGGYGVTPRFKTPQPVLYQSQPVFNNISIDASSVGAINTGNVQQIDVAMDRLCSEGNEALAEALKEFTEAAANTQELEIAVRNDLLEQLSFIAVQSALAKESRKPGLVRAALAALRDVATTTGALATAWEKLEPLLRHVL